MFKPVSECAHYIIHLNMKVRLITVPQLLISAIQLSDRFLKRIFYRRGLPNLHTIAQNDVHCDVRSYYEKFFENDKTKQQT